AADYYGGIYHGLTQSGWKTKGYPSEGWGVAISRTIIDGSQVFMAQPDTRRVIAVDTAAMHLGLAPKEKSVFENISVGEIAVTEKLVAASAGHSIHLANKTALKEKGI